MNSMRQQDHDQSGRHNSQALEWTDVPPVPTAALVASVTGKPFALIEVSPDGGFVAMLVDGEAVGAFDTLDDAKAAVDRVAAEGAGKTADSRTAKNFGASAGT